MSGQDTGTHVYPTIAFGVASLTCLYLYDQSTSPLVETCAEVFNVFIAGCIFVVVWNCRQFIRNNFVLIVGLAYPFVAGFDVLHILAEKGVGGHLGQGSNLASQFGIASGYVQAGSFLLAPLFLGRDLSVRAVLAVLSGTTLFLTLCIVHWQCFPIASTQEAGLTLFAIGSCALISLLLLVSVALLVRRRGEFSPPVLRLLAGSIVLMIGSSISYGAGTGKYDSYVFIEHTLSIFSAYLMYKAIVATGLRQPLDLLFRELSREREDLKASKTGLQMINGISGRILSGLPIRELIDDTLKQLHTLFPALRVAYGTVDAEGRLLIEGSPEPEGMPRLTGWTADLTRAPDYLDSLRGHERVRVNEVSRDPRLAPLAEDLTAAGIGAILSVPIPDSGSSTGQLCFITLGSHNWTEQEASALRDVAEYLPVAIHHACVQAERLQAEESMRESNELFSAFADQVPGYVFVKDQESRILFANRNMKTDFKAENWIGRTAEENLPPGIAEAVMADDRRALGDGFLVQEEWIPDAQGMVRAFETRKFRVDRRDKPPLLGGISFDITERILAQEALRESEEKYRTIFSKEQDAIGILDAHSYEILDLNEACEKLYGYSRLELIGMTVLDLTAEPEETKISMRASVERGESVVPLRYLRRRDGSVFPAEVSNSRIALKGSNVICSIIRDITERTAAEERIQASLREKEVLLREIHHRVKNNLAIIVSLMSLQKQHLGGSTTEEILTDLQDRVRSMALAHEKLYQSEDLARVDAAQYVSSLVDHLVASGGKLPTAITLRKEIQSIALDLDTAIPLGFILTELVSNCVKHAFPGKRGGEIGISLTCGSDGYCRLVVKDDGVGMSEAVDPANPESFGLELVGIFVDQLEGTIEVRREQGTEWAARLRLQQGRPGR